MLAMGASAQTPEKLKIYFDFSWSAQQVVDKVGENLQLDFGGQYQAFNIVDADNAFAPAGYKGMRVDYELGSENTSTLNLHVNVGTPNAWNGMYQMLDTVKTSIEFDFTQEVLNLEKIKCVTIQQAGEGAASVLLKKVTLIKDDASEEQLTPFACTGAGLPSKVESATIKFQDQYNSVQIVDAEGQPLSYDPTSGTTQTYVIEYEAAPSLTELLLLPLDANNQALSYGYNVSGSGTQTATVTFDSKLSAPMAKLRLQANGKPGIDTYPATVTVKSITRTVGTSTSVSDVRLSPADADEQLFNIMGQPVDRDYKGLKISRSGRKFY